MLMIYFMGAFESLERRHRLVRCDRHPFSNRQTPKGRGIEYDPFWRCLSEGLDEIQHTSLGPMMLSIIRPIRLFLLDVDQSQETVQEK